LQRPSLKHWPSLSWKRFGRAIAIAVPLLSAACQRTVNMASVHGPDQIATTIPYAGVRESTRQFPDYSIIDASILSSAAPGKSSPSPGKRGTPR
jgi:hypothetical protein